MKRTRLLIAAGIVLAALIYLIVGGLRTSLVYYITPSELLAEGEAANGRRIRLGGQVVSGSRRWDEGARTLRFVLSDGKAAVPVSYHGTPPDLFTEGQGAVVEGHFDGTVFAARSLIVKHNEVYQPPPQSGEP
jgi:cytochrome c-type biogenesis protein CcmE